MPKTDFDKLFNDFKNLRVAIIGDLMLDTYWWGKVDRISPEAPVPVVAVRKKEQRIGGAGNVALNVRSLGATVDVLGVVGEDEDGKQLKSLLEAEKINTSYLCSSDKRITTNKIRIISRNQHMMRLDAEIIEDLDRTDEAQLLKIFESYIMETKPQVVIMEDYNKGVLTDVLIRRVIELCRQHKIIVTADPKRKNFFSYAGVDIFKPNWKEVKEGLNIINDNIDLDTLKGIHEALVEKMKHGISFITLSEKGVFFQSGNEATLLPTHIRNVADVSGAGDTVIAVASLVYTVTGEPMLMAEVANIAGGLVCEEVGTVAINPDALKQECIRILA